MILRRSVSGTHAFPRNETCSKMSAGSGGHNLRKRKNKEKPEEDVQSIYPDLSKEIDDEDIVDEEIDGEVDGAEVKRVKQRQREHNFDDQWEPEDPMNREPPIQFAILLLIAAIVLAIIAVVINHGRTAGWFD